MPTVDYKGKQLELNEEGFMVHPEEWSHEVAEFLAKTAEGLDNLTDNHWTVINFIREYYLQKNMAPMIRIICQRTGLKLKQIYELFPSGPAKGAVKLAGLPKPDGCV